MRRNAQLGAFTQKNAPPGAFRKKMRRVRREK